MRCDRLWGGLVVLAGLGGCSDGEEGRYRVPPPVTGTVGEPRGNVPYVPDVRARPPEDLAWERCALISGGLDAGAECATVRVPRRWADPTGPQLEVFVKRYRFVPAPRGQVWLLAGGPGGSGADFEDQIRSQPDTEFQPSFEEMSPDLEVYLLDHRGTGRSELLECPELAEVGRSDAERLFACRTRLGAEWSPDLAEFGTTEAAGDLGELIRRTRHGTEPVFVYGVSYGTVWAHRYLQRFPDQASGVVLDSICGPGVCEVALGFDAGFDTIARELFTLCAQDPACRQVLGADPWATLGQVSDDLASGACAGRGLELTRAELRRLFARVLPIWPLRDGLPALVEHLRRCDGAALAAYFEAIAPSYDPADELFSLLLNRHVALSELTRVPPPTEAEAEAHVAGLFVSPDVGLELAGQLERGWVTYPHDAFVNGVATTATPVLMLSGELDPQTPPALAAPLRSQLTGLGQTWVSVPYASHSVLNQSPLGLDDDGTLRTCGQELIAQFLAAPLAPLDTSCTTEVLPPSFDDELVLEWLFDDSRLGDAPPSPERSRRVGVPRSVWTARGAARSLSPAFDSGRRVLR